MPRAQHARSVSGDSQFGNSDDDEGAVQTGGRKSRESAKDQDQRKVQNRIAQREFRQRKAQYIKDLEARVELHESSRDDQLDKLRTGIKALIDENQKLRELLGSVAGFIGGGLGGILPQVGMDLPEFQSLINRGKTEHVFEAINSTAKHGDDGASLNKRSASSYSNASAGPSSKRPRTDEVDSPQEMANSTANSMYSLPTIGDPTLNLSPGGIGVAGGVENHAELYSSISRGQIASPMGETPGFRHTESVALQTLRPPPASHAEIQEHDDTIQELFSMPTDNPKLQAIQLISYHMRNKRSSPAYHLPPSLRATVTQQTVPHSPFFDGIIFASLRDRLILLKDQYDLRTLLNDLVDAVNIHEDDILLPANWELSEPFVRKYWYVIDAEVLGISNRWRKERGERELTMRELVPDGQDIAAEGTLGVRTTA